MSSNLKVNTILPSVGSNIGLGTNGGNLNVDGGCKVQVGTALTLGHSIGLQFATQNLHSAGFEINQINASGIITASQFKGDGSQLTGISGVSVANQADNRLITATGTTDALNGEANLTFDGNNLQNLQSGAAANLTLKATSNSFNSLILDSNRSADTQFAILDGRWNGNPVARIQYVTGSDGTNKDDGYMAFHTRESGQSLAERLRITSTGRLGISEGNPSNQLHVSGTTGTSAGGLLRLDAATGDNFILFDNTSDSTEWAVGYDSTTRSKFDIWYDSNGSNYDLKFSVDGATGAVRKPKNPVFIAYRVSNYSLTTTETELVYESEKIDVGGNYNPSNGRFTAPVDGLYEFAYASIAHNSNTVYRYTLKVNGNDPYSPLRMELRIHQASSEYGTNGEFVVYVNMTAGQYASVYAKSDSNVSNTYGSSNYGYTYFRGRLIG